MRFEAESLVLRVGVAMFLRNEALLLMERFLKFSTVNSCAFFIKTLESVVSRGSIKSYAPIE